MAAYNNHQDQLESCPYDPAHKVLSSRLQNHITKCKGNHLDKDMKPCSFNARHIVPTKDWPHHMSNCPDRLPLDKMLAAPVYENEYSKGRTAVPSYNCRVIESTESWDEEIGPSGSAGYVPKEPTASNGLITDLGMMKPAERKKVYKQIPRTEDVKPVSLVPDVKTVPSRQPKLSYETFLNRGGGIGRGVPVKATAGLPVKAAENGERQPQSSFRQIVSPGMSMGRGGAAPVSPAISEPAADRQPRHSFANMVPQSMGLGRGNGQPIRPPVSGDRQPRLSYNNMVPQGIGIGRGNVEKAFYEENFPSL